MKQIITVEDDPRILDTMIIILRSAGYQVTSYPDGEAILNGDFTPPSIFIIDRQLPGVDGLDICKHLKKNETTKDIPVIMVSASPHIQAFAKNAGADDAIEKLFKMKELRDIVTKHLK